MNLSRFYVGFAAAPALVPCPSASPRLLPPSRRLSSLACQCPPSPAVVSAAAATDVGGHARQIVAVRCCPLRPAAALAVPSTSVVQRRHNHCRHQSHRQSRAFWAKYLFTHRRISTPVVKSKIVKCIVYGTTFKETGFYSKKKSRV